MNLRRKIFAINFKEVGLLRVNFIAINIIIVLMTIWYLINPGWFFQESGFSLPYLSRGASLAVLIILIEQALVGLAFLMDYWTKLPNYTWFEIKILGEKKFIILDSFLAIMAISFFAARLATSEAIWFHYLAVSLFIVGLVGNIFSRNDICPLDPYDLPLPPDPPQLSSIEQTDEAKPLDMNNYFIENYLWNSVAASPAKIEKFPISKSDYALFQQKGQEDLTDGAHGAGKYPERVQNGITDDLRRLVSQIASYHIGCRNLIRLDNMLQFVHQFAYKLDLESKGVKDYARYPIETLIDKVGDCECMSILFAALLNVHGYRTALLYTKDHCMAGVEVLEPLEGDYVVDKEGIRYYICEATGNGWLVGQKPEGDLIVDVVPL